MIIHDFNVPTDGFIRVEDYTSDSSNPVIKILMRADVHLAGSFTWWYALDGVEQPLRSFKLPNFLIDPSHELLDDFEDPEDHYTILGQPEVTWRENDGYHKDRSLHLKRDGIRPGGPALYTRMEKCYKPIGKGTPFTVSGWFKGLGDCIGKRITLRPIMYDPTDGERVTAANDLGFTHHYLTDEWQRVSVVVYDSYHGDYPEFNMGIDISGQSGLIEPWEDGFLVDALQAEIGTAATKFSPGPRDWVAIDQLYAPTAETLTIYLGDTGVAEFLGPGSFEADLTTLAANLVDIKYDGAYRKAIPYVKHNGAWRPAKVFVRTPTGWRGV